MDYVKISVTIEQIDFDYTNLFKKRKHKSYFGWGILDALLFSTYTSVVEMDTTEIENETNELEEKLKNRAIENLQHRFKDFELDSIKFTTSLIQASKQTAEWCIANLSIPQLVNMGISIVNGED